MTLNSIISIRFKKRRYERDDCLYVFFFFPPVMPYYVLVDPRLGYGGSKNRLLAAKRATDMTETCNTIRTHETLFATRYIINILFECERDQRGFREKRKELSRTLAGSDFATMIDVDKNVDRFLSGSSGDIYYRCASSSLSIDDKNSSASCVSIQ